MIEQREREVDSRGGGRAALGFQSSRSMAGAPDTPTGPQKSHRPPPPSLCPRGGGWGALSQSVGRWQRITTETDEKGIARLPIHPPPRHQALAARKSPHPHRAPVSLWTWAHDRFAANRVHPTSGHWVGWSEGGKQQKRDSDPPPPQTSVRKVVCRSADTDDQTGQNQRRGGVETIGAEGGRQGAGASGGARGKRTRAAGPRSRSPCWRPWRP